MRWNPEALSTVSTILEYPIAQLYLPHTIVAFHEAGHAVVGSMLGYRIQEIDFTALFETGAVVRWARVPSWKGQGTDYYSSASFLADQANVLMTLAGYEAERHFLPREVNPYIVHACPYPQQFIPDMCEVTKVIWQMFEDDNKAGGN